MNIVSGMKKYNTIVHTATVDILKDEEFVVASLSIAVVNVRNGFRLIGTTK
jgi:hypothetical protein